MAFVNIFVPVKSRSLALTSRCHRQHAQVSSCAVRPSNTPKARTSRQQSVERAPPVKKTFDWENQWYAVNWEADLSESRPYAFTLWDKALVMFRSRDGEYVVLEDICPHRLAPLSEGRLVQLQEGTAIECPYHGWTFNCSGSCVIIPQLSPGQKPPSSATRRKYPTATFRGLIFVWFGDPALANDEELPIPSFVREYEPSEVVMTRMLMRYVPYDFVTLVENLIDPAHVQWAHHRAAPQWNRGNVSHKDLTKIVEHDKYLGEIFAHRSEENASNINIIFKPPGLISYSTFAPFIGEFSTVFLASPAGRGRARICIFITVAKAQNSLFTLALRLTPRWMQHCSSNVVFEGDTILLRAQERVLQVAKSDGFGGAWRGRFMLATGSNDATVLAYRSWLDNHSQSMPWQAPPNGVSTTEELSRSEMLERYLSHTIHCSSCRGALAGLQAIKWGSVVGGIGSLTVFISYVVLRLLFKGVQVFRPYSWLVPAVSGTVALVLGLTILWCTYWAEQLVYTEKARRAFDS